jgi:hypothetical protein
MLVLKGCIFLQINFRGEELGTTGEGAAEWDARCGRRAGGYGACRQVPAGSGGGQDAAAGRSPPSQDVWRWLEHHQQTLLGGMCCCFNSKV